MAAYFLNERLFDRAKAENVLVVHPHAQRTGGNTLRTRVFARVFGEDRIYSSHFLPHAKRWRNLSDADLAPYRAYSDLQNFVPIQLTRPYVAIGLLRDPVERAASLYHFARARDGHRHQALALSTGIEEFYLRASRRDPSYFRNLQCRRICGRADAAHAVATIQSHYIGVGFTEDLDAFIEALRGVFGWPEVKRRTKARAEYATEITPGFRDMVLAENGEDMELYEAMRNGPPYAIAPRPLSRQIENRWMRTRDLALTVLGRLG